MDYLWTPWRYAYLVDADPGRRKGVPEELAAWPGDCDCVFCNLIAATRFAIEQGGSRSGCGARGQYRVAGGA